MRKNQLYIFGFTFLITLCAGALLFYEEGEYKAEDYVNGESNQWTEWSQSLIEMNCSCTTLTPDSNPSTISRFEFKPINWLT